VKSKKISNWKSAFGWTALVAAVTCAFFATMMMGSLYLAGVFEPDTSATDATEIVNHRVDSLAAEVKALREHNEEMAKYLEAWTPLKCRRELGVREKWPLGVPGLGLPEIVPNSYLQVEGAFICE